MEKKKIIIIGGGIGGIMTSIALNKKSISNSIYEKSGTINESGAGLSIWANATSILDKFGILERLMPYSNILDKMKLSTSGGNFLSEVSLKKLEDEFHFPSIVLLRSDLQRELMNTISPSQINFNKEYSHIENTADGLNVHFSDGTFEEASAVIFADGIHSRGRQQIFNASSLAYAGRTSWRGVAQFDKPFSANGSNNEILGNGKRMGIFPLTNNMVYWYAAVNMKEGESLKQKRTIECVLSHFKNWVEPVSTVLNNTSEKRLILTNINYAQHIEKFVKGNIALLGDAAHPMTPDLGQGACQAIEDAYVLSDCMAQNKGVADCLLDYENKRLQKVKSIAKNSLQMGRIRQMENPIGVILRNNLFRMMPESLALKLLKRNIIIEK